MATAMRMRRKPASLPVGISQEQNLDRWLGNVQAVARFWFDLEDKMFIVPPALTKENFRKWGRINLLPGLFPDFQFHELMVLGNGRCRAPGLQFYRVIARLGLDQCHSTRLYEGLYLVDVTPWNDFSTPRDPLWPVIAELRKKSKIPAYPGEPDGSRFRISGQDWREKVCPAYAGYYEIEGYQEARLERAIEFHAIAHLLGRRSKVQQWFEECYPGPYNVNYQLFGGEEGDGRREPNLLVLYDQAGVGYPNIAGRPIIRF